MKRPLLWLIATVVIVGAGAAGYNRYYASRNGAANGQYLTAPVKRDDITLTVNSNGTVQPVLQVQVGSYASGPIQKVCVDFNDIVKKDQILAEIDPQIYKGQCRQAKAALDHSVADLEQFKARLNQTERDFKRAKELYKITDIPGTDRPIKGIADSDYDLAKANFEMASANVEVAKATVEQNKATLDMAETSLTYTTIRSPVDGVVIDRKVDAGQTVAAQFQTPVLFIVAPDLEKKVYVYASVDEADIGLIRDAQSRDQPVEFTVDAYPKDAFQGKIFQVRLNPTTVQNVVTYTVVVESPNPQIKLLPGMTANLVFQIEIHAGVPTVPNAALRFYPRPDQVRQSDRAILTSAAPNAGAAKGNKSTPQGAVNRRYVWVADGDLLAAVKIETGLSDKSCTEVLSGNLREGQEVVIGMQSDAAKTP
ncbi:MAG: efflux RND transporter periplasmic adaptor subunit [Thermoguttaceae bacterium]|jgi:HlyD family secretion protein